MNLTAEIRNILYLHHADCVCRDCDCHLMVNQNTGYFVHAKPSFLFVEKDGDMPVHPHDLGIIDITMQDLYDYVNAMEAYQVKKQQFIPLAEIQTAELSFIPFSDLLSERKITAATK